MPDDIIITDNYGDTIEVRHQNDRVYVELAELGVGEASVALDPEQADELAEALASAAAQTTAPDSTDPRTAWNETVFRLATQYGRLVIFDYEKENSRVIERRKLRPDTVDGLVVTGHDIAREEVRAFRLDRVKGWAKVG